MHIIGTLIIGFVIGLIARALMPGSDRAGCFVTAFLGVLGAVVGSYLGQALGFYGPNEPAGFIMSVFGALIILFIYRLVRKGS